MTILEEYGLSADEYFLSREGVVRRMTREEVERRRRRAHERQEWMAMARFLAGMLAAGFLALLFS